MPLTQRVKVFFIIYRISIQFPGAGLSHEEAEAS